jgi:hypothetical protein
VVFGMASHGVWCSDDLKKRPLILFTSNYHLFIAT